MKTTHIGLNRALPLLACMLFAASATAQQKAPDPREAIQKQFESKVDIRFDQPYAGNSNPRQMLDLYLPKTRASDKPLPVVVFIHGGGWSGGDRKGYAGQAAAMASTGDYAAASVGYRLSGEAKWPAQIYDCKAAIRWITAHADELKIDPKRIGVTGASAGGHLVTLLGLTGGVKELEGDVGENTNAGSRVACVVNFCGPTDMTEPLMQGKDAERDDPAVTGLIGGSIKDKLDAAKQASPLTYVTKDAVPIMTVHGTKDMRVNYTHAIKLDESLKKVGASSLLIEMTGAGHGIPQGPELNKRIQQFFDLHLRDVPAQISTAPIAAAPAAPKPAAPPAVPPTPAPAKS